LEKFFATLSKELEWKLGSVQCRVMRTSAALSAIELAMNAADQ